MGLTASDPRVFLIMMQPKVQKALASIDAQSQQNLQGELFYFEFISEWFIPRALKTQSRLFEDHKNVLYLDGDLYRFKP